MQFELLHDGPNDFKRSGMKRIWFIVSSLALGCGNLAQAATLDNLTLRLESHDRGITWLRGLPIPVEACERIIVSLPEGETLIAFERAPPICNSGNCTVQLMIQSTHPEGGYIVIVPVAK